MKTHRITFSKIKIFKNCRRRYFFEYVEQLRPIQEAAPLAIGTAFHENIANLLIGKPFNRSDLPGIMADAYDRFIPWREYGVVSVEKQFEISIGFGTKLIGKIDAVCSDGTPIEHKSSKIAPNETYRERLFLDEQVSCYLLAQKGKNRMIYDVVQKPSIRLRQGETEDEYLKRCYEWYTPERVQSFSVVRTEQELQSFKEELLYLSKEIRKTKIFYRNPQACVMLNCPFSGICQDYDPHCLCGFVRKERENEELC